MTNRDRKLLKIAYTIAGNIDVMPLPENIDEAREILDEVGFSYTEDELKDSINLYGGKGYGKIESIIITEFFKFID